MPAPAFTRAYVITPAPDAPSVKKELLLVAARASIVVSLILKKLDVSRRTRLVIRSALEMKLDQYLSALTAEHPSWLVEQVDLEAGDDEDFTGKRIVPTPGPISGGAGSSGNDDASYSASVDSGSTASARLVAKAHAELERERAARLAAQAAAEQAEAAAQLAAQAATQQVQAVTLQAQAAIEQAQADAQQAQAAARQAQAAAQQQSEAMMERAVAALQRLGMSKEDALKTVSGDTV